MKKSKQIYLLFTLLVLFISMNVSYLKMGVSHSPKYVDLKYYEEDEILSVYVTHGVSDYAYHYVNVIIIEFHELLNNTFKVENQDSPITEPMVLAFGSPNKTQEFVFHYSNQSTHQVFHNNYTLPAEEWTLINVTAICIQGGQLSNTMVVGHYPYYDPEHSMLEAVVPTIICTIVTLTPLAVIRIVRRNKEYKSN